MCCLQEKVFDAVRISKLQLFAEYLCGTEPALMTYDVERSCYVSAVTPSSLSAVENDQQLPNVSKCMTDTEAKVF